MTRDDAIKVLKNPCKYSPLGLGVYNEAIQTAIEALEEKPCEDTISRSQALEHIQHRLYETALNVTKKSTADIRDIYEDIAERQIVTWMNELPARKAPASETIDQLENLKSHCKDMARDGSDIWEKDIKALAEAIAVLSQQNKDLDFLNFLYNHINPNEMENYMAMYNSKGVPTCGARTEDGE